MNDCKEHKLNDCKEPHTADTGRHERLLPRRGLQPGFPVYKIILYAVWALVALFILIRGFFVYRTLAWSAEKWENRKRMTKKNWITLWCCVGAVLIALAVVFFIFIWPELSKALVT